VRGNDEGMVSQLVVAKYDFVVACMHEIGDHTMYVCDIRWRV